MSDKVYIAVSTRYREQTILGVFDQRSSAEVCSLHALFKTEVYWHDGAYSPNIQNKLNNIFKDIDDFATFNIDVFDEHHPWKSENDVPFHLFNENLQCYKDLKEYIEQEISADDEAGTSIDVLMHNIQRPQLSNIKPVQR